jgi:two-component system nitrate/nitrite response regulator NarL
MMAPVRLLVVDDHTLFRRGLIALLGQDARFCVVGEAGDAGEAQRRAGELMPDLILLDNHLPGVSGVDALRDLREASPRSRVMMLTVSEDERDLADALRNGAQGYLLKTVDADMLAIQSPHGPRHDAVSGVSVHASCAYLERFCLARLCGAALADRARPASERAGRATRAATAPALEAAALR